jgi:hypothetical protein
MTGNDITTSSDEVHVILLMVHLRVYVTPKAPVKTVVGIELFTKTPPEPLIMVHTPE